MNPKHERLIREAYVKLLKDQNHLREFANRLIIPPANLAFTIDGKLLGDLGELVACLEFGLTPAPAGSKGVDAHTADGMSVEVKSTGGGSEVYIPGNSEPPHFLVVVSFNPSNGSWEFIYHGIAACVWSVARHAIKSGRAISLAKLKHEQGTLTGEDVLPRATSYENP